MFDDPLIQKLDLLPNDKLMTEKHLAFLLEVSVSKLQKDRVAGNPPPYVKVRGAVRYRVGDYREFVKANTVASTSAADSRRLQFAGADGGTPYALIGDTIYDFLGTLDRDVDDVLVGNVATFRAMGYQIAVGGI